GAGPFTYQWSLDGAASGSNAASLSVNTTALAIGDHTVRVIVSGQCGSVTKSATLKVNAGITATGPSDTTVCQGTDASFSTVASGARAYAYPWGPEGAAIGSNAASLSVSTTALTIGNHTVRVIVSGQCGSATNSA